MRHDYKRSINYRKDLMMSRLIDSKETLKLLQILKNLMAD